MLARDEMHTKAPSNIFSPPECATGTAHEDLAGAQITQQISNLGQVGAHVDAALNSKQAKHKKEYNNNVNNCAINVKLAKSGTF